MPFNLLCREATYIIWCVQTSYPCIEGETIACECVKQHFHINDDAGSLTYWGHITSL